MEFLSTIANKAHIYMKYRVIHKAGNSVVIGALWQGNGRTNNTTAMQHSHQLNCP